MKTYVQISKEEYFKLLKDNKAELSCYSSCTDIDYVLTEWGWNNKDEPFIKAVDQLRYDETANECWEYRYYKYI